MYKKVLEKIASAGTVALMGYEIGSHNSEKPVEENKGHNSEIIIIAGILLIVIVAAATIKLLKKNQPVV